MSQYTPNPPPYNADLATLTRWMDDELQAIARCMSEADAVIKLSVNTVAPEKTGTGDVREADGVTWNPGSGSGTYIFRAGAWVKLG